MELGHIEYFEIRLNVYEYILDKGFIEGGFMPYEVWLPGLTYREKIVNYNSLKVLADLGKERNFMHIGCKNLFVKAAFWYSGYQCGTNDFRKSFVIMEMLLFYITERYSVQFEL